MAHSPVCAAVQAPTQLPFESPSTRQPPQITAAAVLCLQHILAAAACGSHLHVITDAHHLQFCSAGSYHRDITQNAFALYT
jgi:hypothetical protein